MSPSPQEVQTQKQTHDHQYAIRPDWPTPTRHSIGGQSVPNYGNVVSRSPPKKSYTLNKAEKWCTRALDLIEDRKDCLLSREGLFQRLLDKPYRAGGKTDEADWARGRAEQLAQLLSKGMPWRVPPSLEGKPPSRQSVQKQCHYKK